MAWRSPKPFLCALMEVLAFILSFFYSEALRTLISLSLGGIHFICGCFLCHFNFLIQLCQISI